MAEKRQSWASVKEVAKHLGVSRESVYRWVESRGMPAHRIGRLMKFSFDDVDTWVRSGGSDLIGDVDRGSPRSGNAPRLARRRSWSTSRNSTRERLALRFAEVIVSMENARASIDVECERGELQRVLSELLTLRSKLETMPECKLTTLTTVDHLAVLADAVEALTTADSSQVRTECLSVAWDSVLQISRQF